MDDLYIQVYYNSGREVVELLWTRLFAYKNKNDVSVSGVKREQGVVARELTREKEGRSNEVVKVRSFRPSHFE